ncbi:hypothetical protein DYI42_19905 [Vannielia litorea]|nr:hypothetical protein [Vannielia litorea]
MERGTKSASLLLLVTYNNRPESVMKRHTLPLAALALALSAVSVSAAGVQISCARGPLPKVALINGPTKAFIKSIEANYAVSPQEAEAAADYVCADMAAVGKPDLLRARTRTALASYRRR